MEDSGQEALPLETFYSCGKWYAPRGLCANSDRDSSAVERQSSSWQVDKPVTDTAGMEVHISSFQS